MNKKTTLLLYAHILLLQSYLIQSAGIKRSVGQQLTSSAKRFASSLEAPTLVEQIAAENIHESYEYDRLTAYPKSIDGISPEMSLQMRATLALVRQPEHFVPIIDKCIISEPLYDLEQISSLIMGLFVHDQTYRYLESFDLLPQRYKDFIVRARILRNGYDSQDSYRHNAQQYKEDTFYYTRGITRYSIQELLEFASKKPCGPELSKYYIVGSLRGIEKIENLRSLNIYHGTLTSIPSELFSHPDLLQMLQLKGNFISHIKPGTFHKFPNLRWIDLRDNEIEKIGPETFANLSQMTRLDLSNNYLRIIPTKTFTQLPRLQRIYLDDNEIEVIDTGTFAGLPSLEIVDLSFNPLRTIKTKAFTRLPSLEELSLLSIDPSLQIEPGAFDELPSLRTITVHNKTLWEQKTNIVHLLCEDEYYFSEDYSSDEYFPDDAESSEQTE